MSAVNPLEVLRAAKGRPLAGSLRLPGDKSISHRALMLASLAAGTSRLRGMGTGLDVRSTISCLRRLGVELSRNGPDLRITGRLRGDTLSAEPFTEPTGVLDCGNSGTTMRLVLGLLAGSSGLAVLTGDHSLSARPMRRVTAPLAAMGARIWGREGGALAPLAVLGSPLQATSHDISVASAQVKSALLLAGLRADGLTRVTEPTPSRDHTELMLEAMGADLTRVDDRTAAVSGPATLVPLDIEVPGDPSSAAFWVAAGLAVPGSHIELRGVSLNPRRSGMLRVLQRAGANLTEQQTHIVAGEPVGDIEVRWSELAAFQIGPSEIPALIDELPVLSLLACIADGRSVISGAGELRHKETDRLACIARGLRAMGVAVDESADGLSIEGPQRLTAPSQELSTDGDHRMAMSWAIASLIVAGELQFDGLEGTGVSYPAFYSDIAHLAGGGR